MSWVALFLFSYLLGTVQGCCKGFATLSTSGSFRCPVYVDNMNCTWLIEAPPSTKFSRINFHASSIDTELNNDYLRIFDGPTIQFPVLGTFSGPPLHNTDPFVSSGRKILVQFKSDSSKSGGSFGFQWNTDRCLRDTEYNAESAFLTDGSPQFGRYRNGTCHYSVKPKTAVDQITIYFEELDLALNDTVTISEDSTVIARVSGSGLRAPFYARQKFSIDFASQVDTSKASPKPDGFSLRYAAGYCVPHVDIVQNLIQITDGSGSKNYRDSTYCEWLIRPSNPAADMITFFPSFLATAEQADIITVYDGPTNTSAKIGTFWGKKPLNPVYSSGNQMLVTWKTDGSRNDEGWTASAIAGGCLEDVLFTSQEAFFTDGSGNGSITSNVCSWTVIPAKADKMVTIYISNVSLAAGVLQVYDGVNGDLKQLSSVTSGNDPIANFAVSPIYARQNFTLQMKGAQGGAGFTVQYASGRCVSSALLVGPQGEINDGSGDANYLDSTKCNWLIRPPLNTTGIEITFVGNTAEASDKVVIYDGMTEKFPVLGTLYGEFGTKTFRSTSEMIYVTWYSDGSKNSAGWKAQYKAF